MAADRMTLHGCAPTPLASYLKALGVLRLLSSGANSVTGEPADPTVRGWWQSECFQLRTTLGHDGLMEFFLHEYAPSPVIAPWNGRAGFLEGDVGEASTREGALLMRRVNESECSRLQPMRSAVRLLRSNDDLVTLDALRTESKALNRLAKQARELKDEEEQRECEDRKKLIDKRVKVIKGRLLPTLRSTISDIHVTYVDSCYAIAADQRMAKPAPLLGAGGLDGSRDFGVRFAAALRKTFAFDTGEPHADAERSLGAAIFKTAVQLPTAGSIGMFHPGGTGPNSTVGYVGVNPLNYWDVILAMEGTMVFAGALTRRWQSRSLGGASFPFTFEPAQAGSGRFSADDPNRPRGEIWTPLWSKPVRYPELRSVFAEGRLTIGGGTAQNGLDAARSVVSMGTSRGLSGFERYSLIQPDRKLPYQATPLGRLRTPAAPRPDLIADLEIGGWLRTVRSASSGNKASARAKSTVHALEDSLFAMTNDSSSAAGTRQAIIALGRLVHWLSKSLKARKIVNAPPPLLSRAWLLQADDGSPEFRVAAALAGLGIPPQTAQADSDTDRGTASMRPPPMAAHFAPLTNAPREGFESATFFRGRWLRERRAWSGDNRPATAVWGCGGLTVNSRWAARAPRGCRMWSPS